MDTLNILAGEYYLKNENDIKACYKQPYASNTKFTGQVLKFARFGRESYGLTWSLLGVT